MLSVSEALQKLLAALQVTERENISLPAAANSVLADDLIAVEDSPRFDNSSMDGFAVRSADLNGATESQPTRLAVVADIPAGTFLDKRLESGQAMRIMTGAAMPPGADAVVPVEDTDSPVAQAGAPLPKQVHLRRSLKPGDYVRPAGQDFSKGQVLLQSGQRIRPQDLALLAMQGVAQLRVHKRARVAIFSSGNELLAPDEKLAPGKIHETNAPMLAALVETTGAEAALLGIARDTLQDAQTHLDRAIELGADLIISSAGVSVGAFDFLREAVLSRGELDFWKVNMRPGRPLAFGRYRQVPYIGLPGNPASAFVGFEVFVRPALHKMGGEINWQRKIARGTLADPIDSDGRESYLRVQTKNVNGEPQVHLTGHQGSGNLFSLVRADALMRVPAGVTSLSAGSSVEIWPL